MYSMAFENKFNDINQNFEYILIISNAFNEYYAEINPACPSSRKCCREKCFKQLTMCNKSLILNANKTVTTSLNGRRINTTI